MNRESRIGNPYVSSRTSILRLGGGGGRNPEVDFRGERRSNETHDSPKGLETRLAKKCKGKGARLCFGALVLSDNREGLVVDVRLTPSRWRLGPGHGEVNAVLAAAPDPWRSC